MHFPEISVQISRGGITESEHRISAVSVNNDGKILQSWGDTSKPVYPRSAIKALQTLAFVELGGAETFGFTDQELALCCASHGGETEHVRTAQSMLSKLSLNEESLQCGAHWPTHTDSAYQLAREQGAPDQRHNNCSGKHAAMLGLALHLNADTNDYIHVDHPVQQCIMKTMSEMCDIDMSCSPVSPDGCSAPTWAIPLNNLALGFARFAAPHNLSPARKAACERLYRASVSHPYMVAGTNRYCTNMMQVLGSKVFLKTGAEGVYIAAIPEQGMAIALKCEDGATRGAERTMTALLDYYQLTQGISDTQMAQFREPEIVNFKKIQTGNIFCELPN